MKRTYRKIGTTSTGKPIYCEPSKNTGFEKKDHLEAYHAHAKHLTYGTLCRVQTLYHRRAMNEHFILAAKLDDQAVTTQL